MFLSRIKQMFRSKDSILGLGIIVLGLLVVSNATKYHGLTSMVPILLGFFMLVIGVVMLIQTGIKAVPNRKELGFSFRETLLFVILFVTIYLMEILGFYTSVLLGIIAVNYIILDNFKRKLLVSIIISFLITVSLYILFQHILFIPTPRGLFV